MAIGLLFAVLLAASIIFQQSAQVRPYDPDSAGSSGLLALRLWLEEMGHPLRVVNNNLWDTAPATPESARREVVDAAAIELLFVFPNAAPYTEDEAQQLQRWVRNGGTLVLIGPDALDGALSRAFGVFQHSEIGFASRDYQQQPLLPDSPAVVTQPGLRGFLDLEDAPDAAPIWASSSAHAEPGAEDAPMGDAHVARDVTAAVQQVGEGVVWHLSTHYDLTNSMLQNADAAYLVPAFLRTVAPGGMAAIDAYHLFALGAQSQTGEIGSVRDWLFRARMGQATLLLMVLVLLYLFLQGWRLGPALPVPAARRRREAAEYVEAMAGLQRRARQQAAVAAHFKQRLKVRLGRTHQLRTDLADADFVAQLRSANRQLSDEQINSVARLFQTLESNPSENQLIQAAREIDEIVS